MIVAYIFINMSFVNLNLTIAFNEISANKAKQLSGKNNIKNLKFKI